MPAAAVSLDEVRLSLDGGARLGLSLILAFVMFGVALGLRVSDFHRLARRPGAVALGALLQLVALPALTWLVAGLAPSPSVALGMMVVAACPGGNVSNFLTSVARGDVALSVSLTALASVAAVIATPINIVVWASLRPETRALLAAVGLDRGAFLLQVLLTLGVPLAAGMALASRRPGLALRLRGPCRALSFGALALFVVGAVLAHRGPLLAHGAQVMPIVIGHNALALGLGYFGASAARRPGPERRALTFEVGIQNSGLGLVILLAHFDGLGGAALVTAGWGVWHLVSGTALAVAWLRLGGAAAAGPA